MEDQKYRDEEDLQEKLDSFKSKDSWTFLNTDIVHTCLWHNFKRACVDVCACVMDLLSPYGLVGMCWSCHVVVVLALRVLDMCFLWERQIMVCVCMCVGRDNWNVIKQSSEPFGQSWSVVLLYSLKPPWKLQSPESWSHPPSLSNVNASQKTAYEVSIYFF